MSSILDRFQWEVVEDFFRREGGFFLTGGAALAGFHLDHRRMPQELDLVTTEDRLVQGGEALAATAQALGASIEDVQTSPNFRRCLLLREDRLLVVDLVRDVRPQLFPMKQVIRGIRVDPPEEILVNKLCVLLSSFDLRDLVDVLALERAGYPIERYIETAALKDGGLTPGQLAWVLSGGRIEEDVRPPAGISDVELREYLEDLKSRLARMAMPR